MIARYIFIGILVFFMSFPASAEEDKFAKMFGILDGALRCQAALSLTSNYNLIYRALNRGLEKVNPPEADKFKNKLDGQWKLIQLIVDKSKSELVKLNSNMDFEREEQRLFTEATDYLTTSIRTLKVNDEHIVNLMKLNSSCTTRAPIILNELVETSPKVDP
jgi:hypothetical protein